MLDYTHGYNDDDNLTARLDNLDSANDRSFGYDEAHRLTDASGPWGAGTSCVATSSTYEYDLNGNRTCKGEGASSTTYTYAAGSNQISTAMGAESATYSHDTAGNVTGDGTHTFGFDDAGRLAAVDGGATATYTYDGEGRRVIKTAGGEITYFFYHPDGKLLTEMVPADEAGKDYIYLGDTPLARMDWAAQEVPLGEIEVLAATASAPNVHLDWSAFPAGSNRYVVRRKQIVDFSDKSFDGNVVIATPQDPVQTFDDPVLGDANDYFYRVFRRVLSDALYLYHADHLGTPIAMTDGAGALVWRAEHLPFGGIHTLPVSSVENNLRFSGQYLDGETGLHQNWFRDYDRAIGRYREPDPIGLSLSTPTNLYAYVDSLPTTFVDLLGLVRTAADCSVCCTAEEAQRELDQSWQWTQTQSSKYRWGPIRTCRGYSCGRSADELRWDLEANVKPMCWITSTQLTPGFAGKAFHKLIGRPLGLQGPTAYFSVHFVVKYQPCEGPAPNYFFDAYIGAKHGILDPSEEIQ